MASKNKLAPPEFKEICMEVRSGQNSLFLLLTIYLFRFTTGIIFIHSLN